MVFKLFFFSSLAFFQYIWSCWYLLTFKFDDTRRNAKDADSTRLEEYLRMMWILCSLLKKPIALLKFAIDAS